MFCKILIIIVFVVLVVVLCMAQKCHFAMSLG